MPEALIDVVARLRTIAPGDRFEPGPTIFANSPISPESNAMVLAGKWSMVLHRATPRLRTCSKSRLLNRCSTFGRRGEKGDFRPAPRLSTR